MHTAKETSPCEQDPSSTSTATHQSAAKPLRTGRGAKPHVPSACTNCKKAHLACDLQRPCRRCVNSGKCDTCKDVQHKKRGRPRSKDKKVPASGAEKSQMEGQMFQFSFTSPTSPASSSGQCRGSSSLSATSVLSPPSPLSHASSPAAATPVSAMATTVVASATAAASHESLPPSPVLHYRGAVSKHPTASRAQAPLSLLKSTAEESAASSTPATSYLFLTPSLLCLRLEELARTSSNTLLGHSLLSLINRNVMDFVSEHDKHSVFSAFETIRNGLSSRLAQSPSRVYSHTVLGHPPPAVDPNTFQALPVDRLLQRVCADVSGNLRAHLRTAAGCYDLFDIHIYVGAVSKPLPLAAATKGVAGLTLDEVYFVCRITKFDALSAAASSPLAASVALPRIVPQQQPMFRGSIRKNSLDDDSVPSDHQAKRRHRIPETTASPNALYLLATVTDSNASSSASGKHSTVSSSPTLTTPSPSLGASVPPRVGTLPPLSDLLKLLDTTGKPQQPQHHQHHQQHQQHQQQHCSLPPSFHTKSFISL